MPNSAIVNDPGYFDASVPTVSADSVPMGAMAAVDMYRKSIIVSSDTYYYKLAYEMGVDAIHNFMVPLGLRADHRHRPAR